MGYTSWKIKICGMREPDNLLQVSTLKPDFVGMIFYPHSPRFVGEDFLLPAGLSKEIRRVGVFVNEKTQRIEQKARTVGFDYVQLHGKELPEACARLRASGLKVIKVFSVGPGFDFTVTQPYAVCADYFLFDTKGVLFGGNARIFDWSLLQAYDQRVPFFLSGGLSLDNVKDLSALRDMNLYALDLNSGVEDRPGVKNVEMIKNVMDAVKRL